MNAVALILSAGRSSRMGRDKALLDYRGRTFLNHLATLALPRTAVVVAVAGHNADRILATLPDSPRVRGVVNEAYDRGMLSSLQAGLKQIPAEADWTLWMLVDHPAVRGRTLDTLLAAARDTDAPLVIPRHNGQRGHPIVFSRSVGDELLALNPTDSPQTVVRSKYPVALFVDVDDRGVVTDIDNPTEYDSLVRPVDG